PGLVLVFLLFYASLRSYSGGSHCKSRIGCFLISMAILSIPVYTHEFVMNNVPATVILMIGIAAVVVILILSPVESINKPLDDEEKKYYARVTHCIVALQVCVLIILFCLGVKDYFYAGYSSIVLVAVFMVMGKVIMKRYI
ncbi:accessory gene regulator B family protein, partial [Agathobacter rectalis]